MDNKILQKAFIEQVNKILSMLDYVKLDQSCNSEDVSYAGEVMKLLHDTLVENYGTEYLDDSLEFVELPVIIRGRTATEAAVPAMAVSLSIFERPSIFSGRPTFV